MNWVFIFLSVLGIGDVDSSLAVFSALVGWFLYLYWGFAVSLVGFLRHNLCVARLLWNLWSSYLTVPSSGIIGVDHHTCLLSFFFFLIVFPGIVF
jgi:hypothetical protein